MLPWARFPTGLKTTDWYQSHTSVSWSSVWKFFTMFFRSSSSIGEFMYLEVKIQQYHIELCVMNVQFFYIRIWAFIMNRTPNLMKNSNGIFSFHTSPLWFSNCFWQISKLCLWLSLTPTPSTTKDCLESEFLSFPKCFASSWKFKNRSMVGNGDIVHSTTHCNCSAYILLQSCMRGCLIFFEDAGNWLR